MKRLVACLLVFLVFVRAPFRTGAQTPNDSCRAAVQHLSLPPTAESPQMHRGLPLSPIQFLYSSEGIDFYSVIFRFPNYIHVGGNSPLDTSLIWVFAVMHCVDEGKGMLSTGRCVVNDVQFFKPQACIVVPQAKNFSDLSMLAASGAGNYRDAINGLNWLTGTDNLSLMTDAPPYFDLPKDAFVKLKQFAAQTTQEQR